MRARYCVEEEDWYVINDQDEVVRFGFSCEEDANEWIVQSRLAEPDWRVTND